MNPRLVLCAALLGCPLSPSVPQTLQPASAVPRIECPQDNSVTYYGSAFRIGPHMLLSVKHVTNNAHCAIDGVPITHLYTSPKADFSMLSDPRAGKWLKVDCRGFVADHQYFAVGHPRAVDTIVAVPLIATGDTLDGMAVLVGVFTAQPGHSGGAIIDAQTHEVVGTVNAANWEEGMTLSVELRGTPVCGGHYA